WRRPQMKKLWRLTPFVLVAMLVLLWNFPGYVLTGKIETATQGKVRILSSSGSVWAGQMQLGLSDGSRVYAVPEPARWRLQFSSSEHWAAIAIEHANLVMPLHLGFDGTGITVTGGELRLPAAWLVALGAPFNTIRPEGLLQLSWARWETGENLQASLKWLDAQSALSSIRPLGEYLLNVSGSPQAGIQLSLVTSKGPLTLEGNGQWTAARGLEFTGHANSDEGSKEALTGLLSQMGRQEGGRYRLGLF
ncbi:MAG TPA: type II secretion system protein N, partial [Limnobacter sp.]|nr:type II secretion system protein N [Limnobacter sp.]